MSDPVAVREKMAFAVGGFANQFMAQSVKQLAFPLLNITAGLSPALVGVLLAVPRLWDAVTDPVMGEWSDRTRTRWGRRRPFILAGAFACGICFPLMWFFSLSWSQTTIATYFLVASLVYYTASTIYSVPLSALGFELTRDYDERTRLMSWWGAALKLSQVAIIWIFPLASLPWFGGALTGVRVIALGIGAFIVVAGIQAALILTERPVGEGDGRVQPISFGANLRSTFKNGPLMQLTALLLCLIIGVNAVGSMGLYVNIYYVCGGDKLAGAALNGATQTIGLGLSILAIPAITKLATRWDKRVIMLGALLMSTLGCLSTWVLYSPDYPYLQFIYPLLSAFGLGAVWLLAPSLMADICDHDEWLTGRRREGAISAFQSWCTKLGYTLSFALSGIVLQGSGFDAAVEGAQSPEVLMKLRGLFALVPAGALMIGLAVFWRYPLTRQRCAELRAGLDARNASTLS